MLGAVAGLSQSHPLTLSCPMRTPRVPVKPARRRQPQTGVITVLIHACTTGILTVKRWCVVVIVHHGCIMIALHRQRSFFPGVWSCFRCRLVPVQVLDLTSSVTALTKLVQDLSQTTIKLQKQHESMVDLLKEKDEAYQQMRPFWHTTITQVL